MRESVLESMSDSRKKKLPVQMANDQLIDTESGESSSETAKWVGPSCGQHGSYTFYKGVRFEYMLPEVVQSTVARERPRRGSQSSRTIYDRNSGDERILAVGDTFFVKVGNAEPTCIGELVLLWHDELNSEDLALLRLYYMPETTPAGRQSQHGEDEVLAVAEKITIRITDLPTWIIEPEEWSYGSCFFLPAITNTQPKKGQVVIDLLSPTIRKMFMSRTNVNLETVNREKEELLQNSVCEKHKEALHRTTNHVVNCEENGYQQQATTAIDATTAVEQSHSNDADSTINNNAVVCRRCDNFHRLRCKLEVVVLAFGEYCRYRTWLKQLEGMAHSGDVCLVSGKRRKIVFCRDSFEYPLVIQDPLVCEEYAPVFKGRPRKRKKNKHRFTRTKTHKTTKSTNDEENTSARRKSSRTRHRPKQINTQLLHYSMFSPNSEVKSSRGRTNSSSSSSASDTHPRNKGASNQRQNRKDLRRSKRRRNNSNSNSDFQLALQNSLMDIGSAQLCYDSQNSAESGNKSSRKRKNSLISSAASGADKGLTNGQKRKRYPSSGCGSTSSDSSSNSDQLSPASPSSSIKSMSSNDVDGFGDIDDDLRDFDSNNPDSFTKALMKFMESNGTPINKIPSLGFKKLNLHEFYTFVQKEGGYQRVTDGKMWRSVYQNTGANPSSTSAATCTRRHYEKLLLPFEKYLRSKSSQLKRKRMKMKTSIDAPTSAPATTADGNKKAPKKTMAPRRQKSSRSESSTNSNSITSETITESKTVLETDKTAESSDATVTVHLESETEKEPEQSIVLKTEQHSPVPASTTPAPASSADDVALDFRTPATACHRVQTMEAGDEQPLDLSVPKTTAGRNAAVVPRESTAIASSTRIAHQIPQMQMLQNGKSTWHKSTTPLNGNCWMNPRNSTSNNSNGVDKPTFDIQHHPIFSMTKSSPLTNADTIKPQNGSSSNGGLPVHAVKPIPANTSDDPAKRAHHQQQQVQMRTSSTTGPVQPRWPAVGGSAVNGRGTATVLPMQRTIANAMRNNEATAANQRLFPQRQQQQHGIIATNSSNNCDQMNSSASSYSRPIASASALRENHHHQQQHTAPSSSSSKLAPHNSETVRRPKESTGVHGASAGGESSARTYYRPTSMLAHHRQHKQQVSQQQQQQNAANSNNLPVGASAAASKEMQQLQNNHLHHQQPKDSASLLQSQQHKIRAQPSNAAMPMQRVLGTAPKTNPASSSNQMPPPPSRNAQHHIKSSDLEKASQQQQQRQQIMQNSNRNASAAVTAAMNKYPNMGHQRLNNVPPDMVNFLASQAQRNDKDRGKDMIASNGGQQMQQQRTNMPPPFSHHQNHHLPAHFDASSMMLAQAAAVASVKQQQQQQSASESVGSTNHHQQQHHHQRQRSHDEAHSSNLIFPSQQQAPSLSGAGSRAPSDRQNNLKPQQAQYASAVAARQQQILQQQQAMSSSKELQHRQMSTADLREPRQALEQQRSSSGASGYPHVQSSRPMQSPHMKPPHGEAPKSKRPQSTHAEQNAATVAAAAHALHSSRATPPKRPRVFQGGNSESGIKSNIDPPQHSGIRLQWSTSDLTAAAQASYSAQNFNNLLTQQMMASRINLRTHQLLEGNGTAAANAVGLNGRNARYSPAEAFSREKNHLAAPASNSRVDRMTSGGSNQPKPAEPARPLSFSVDRLTSPSLDKRSQQLSRDKSPHMRVNEAQKNKQQQQQQPNDHRNSNLRNAQQQAAHQLAFNPATGLPSNRLAASVVPNFQLPGGLPGMPQVHMNRFGQPVISPDLMELVQSMPFLNRELLSGLNPGLLPFVANVPSGQRHPDNSSLNLPLQVDPTFLQSLPPTSAPYAAFPNPSSRSANSRTPNFRYQQHH